MMYVSNYACIQYESTYIWMHVCTYVCMFCIFKWLCRTHVWRFEIHHIRIWNRLMQKKIDLQDKNKWVSEHQNQTWNLENQNRLTETWKETTNLQNFKWPVFSSRNRDVVTLKHWFKSKVIQYKEGDKSILHQRTVNVRKIFFGHP